MLLTEITAEEGLDHLSVTLAYFLVRSLQKLSPEKNYIHKTMFSSNDPPWCAKFERRTIQLGSLSSICSTIFQLSD